MSFNVLLQAVWLHQVTARLEIVGVRLLLLLLQCMPPMSNYSQPWPMSCSHSRPIAIGITKPTSNSLWGRYCRNVCVCLSVCLSVSKFKDVYH